MGPYWQYEIPLWLVMFLFLAILVIPMEVGFRLGIRRHRPHPDAERAERGDVTLASMLALLGLMLAFTYSFCMGRADLRKKALVTEVNAIGTSFVRADLLPEPRKNRCARAAARLCPVTTGHSWNDQNVRRGARSCETLCNDPVEALARRKVGSSARGRHVGSREGITRGRYQRCARCPYQSDGCLL